ncbi:MAG: class I SAM-dependent RNA methyltransferase [Anaerolineales bacterium]|nr:class I SAM-dependent RNA methyltransferase [Anaerolineales bacterium]
MDELFAVAAPGLEPLTAQELAALSLRPMPPETGGVTFHGDLSAISRANLCLRTASRVLLRLGEFHAAAFSELNRHARELPWERFLQPGQGVAVRVTCHKSRLYHSDAVAREIAKAIGSHLGQATPLQKFDEETGEPVPQIILVRLVNDLCSLSIDTSGALLHRRGYRLATAKAPLRETLAAGMLLASRWDRASPLLDPFCGSGTIAIEAALLAAGIAPGSQRRYAFMDWPGFDSALWQILLAESPSRPHASIPPIQASDRDAGAIGMAKANAERAGVASLIEFSHQAVSAIQPTGTGWVVTNPPYGLRVQANKDLRNLYAQFGNVLRRQCPGWHVAILCTDPVLLRQIHIPFDTSISLVNGGVRVLLARGTVNK